MRRHTVPDSPARTFANRLREERQRAGLSQAALAERLVGMGFRIDDSAITRIEKHQRTVKLEEAVAIAQTLDVPLDTLLSDHAAKLRELQQHLERQQSRLGEAEYEFDQARAAVAHAERAIAKHEESRGR
jgi:transcriptional regulator with XRE-family HTH domain